MAAVGNLTGGQVQTVLDHFIYRALAPIVTHSDIFDAQISYLLAFASCNRKRKLSAHDRNTFIDILSKCLSEKDTAVKLEMLSEAKIERSFVCNFLAGFLQFTADYESMYVKLLMATSSGERIRLDRKMRVVETTCNICREHLLGVINAAKANLELAYAFRNRIVMQFVKHSLKVAMSHVDDKGDSFDVRDVSQTLLTAITRAIDKYDCSKGALTSYIGFWLMNALSYSSSGSESGIAYTISQRQRRKIARGETADHNYSVSLDKTYGDGQDNDLKDIIVGECAIDEALERREETYLVQYLSKCADPKGLARLYLNIDEVFSEKEQRRMVEQMRRDGLPAAQ